MRSFVPATTSSLKTKRGRNFPNQLAKSCSASNRLSAWRGRGEQLRYQLFRLEQLPVTPPPQSTRTAQDSWTAAHFLCTNIRYPGCMLSVRTEISVYVARTRGYAGDNVDSAYGLGIERISNSRGKIVKDSYLWRHRWSRYTAGIEPRGLHSIPAAKT